MAGLAVIGREEELAEVASFLDRAAAASASLVLVGEAGVGKTTLWQAGVEAAHERSFRVLAASPSVAETGLSFAAICDLLGEAADDVLVDLPAPQRHALEVALLLTEAEQSTPDPRAVAVALLSAVRVLTRSEPVLVAVDDVQWIDSASAGVLGYAARRLRGEPVGLLLAQRAPEGEPLPLGLDRAAAERVSFVRVGPLTLGATHRLVRERLGVPLPRPVLRRVHETAGGNPFYALEIARALPLESAAAGQPLPVPGSLGELVRDRVAALPTDARQVLLAVAALSEPRLSVVEAALQRDPRPGLGKASEAGVVAVEGDRVRFVHPLLASAAYGLAGDDDRRAVHRRLADAVGVPEQRARHLALAAHGPDEQVAAELEAAALGARARGAVAAAAELAEQAAALTLAQDKVSRFRRALLAAQYRFQAGDADGSRRLLEELAGTSAPSASRALALTELARVVNFQGSRRRALALVREALAHADEPRSRLAAEERLASILVVLREDLPAAREHALRSVDVARRMRDPVALARALTRLGSVGGLTGDADAVAALERAVALEREHGGFFVGAERPSFDLAAVLMWRGELDRARKLFTVVYRETAEEGDEASSAWMADNLANIEFLAGDWDAARRWANEGDELAAQTGQPGQQAYAKATIALVHACRGEVDAARAAAADALELSGDEVAIGWMNACWALGLLALSLGNAAAAHEALDLACTHAEREGVGEPGTMRFVFDDVEALASLGRIEEAERRLAFIEGHAVRLDRGYALATAARCRGILAAAAGDREAALEAFARALAQHDRDPNAFDRARTLLPLGATQRAAKQKRAARETLTEAFASFEELGAPLWAVRARDELGRISGRAPSRDELTPTERRVAELVAEGMTNQDVAAALFVSPRTVEFHLRNVFRKLDVRTRGELARRLSTPVA